MGGQRETLFTLLLITAVTRTVTSEERQMSMSPSAVDDQFSGCRAEMREKVMGKGGLLEQELKSNVAFREVWRSIKCGKTIPGGRQEHTLAMQVYTHASKKFLSDFDSAVESRGANNGVDSSSFPYKSLHFLLTEALQLLQTSQCHTVSHSSEHRYGARVGEEVRFGRFVSTMTGESHAAGTLFHITSCAAVKVARAVVKANRACSINETELLVPPFEVFMVEDVKTSDNYTEITLNHTRFHSYHDCYLFPSSGDSVGSSMLVLLAASLCLCPYVLGHTL
ncbi:ecto-ADP-ribosyltransferase 5-like [Megalops cyprinoides]|uniref:ecto-ADP-ribosyltransferase 5-like n=1 Tax=Megalops cyprinoides TaxID=118141 RepID=UPI00186403CB|nr:ecto-ADP-ribosyltransferase 5-like [Megalops cyprinoides]XP_036372755.1 ecto-ADP-ribosyltransferase 5-like [Megalops cyprinoides]